MPDQHRPRSKTQDTGALPCSITYRHVEVAVGEVEEVDEGEVVSGDVLLLGEDLVVHLEALGKERLVLVGERDVAFAAVATCNQQATTSLTRTDGSMRSPPSQVGVTYNLAK